MEKEQFKLMMEPQLRDRLKRLAVKCGYGSAQEFVIASLDDYAELLGDLLLEARDQAELLRKRQRDQLTSRGAQSQEPGSSRRK